MAAKDDGGPAFPAEGPSAGQFENCGMSLRDYFAGLAMQGFVANGACGPGSDCLLSDLAEDAYRVADAMLEERSK